MANEFQTNMCSNMSSWNTMRDFNNESINWSTQPFLPVELSQMYPCFGDPSFNQFDTMDDQAFFLPELSMISPPSKQQVNFNNTPYWRPPSNSFEDESICSNQITMKRSETKKVGSEPASKKPRITTPSPLPTFKVRKEKLGDRIIALQQLVSPFGKTDTASVLEEAIDYIKFLHGQVGTLSTPYLKNGHQMQHQKGWENLKDEGQDLRSRGLCLVPISSTFEVASETSMDFWIPTILGNYI